MATLVLSSRHGDHGKMGGESATSGKLFRPWAGAKDQAAQQDSTVSTTTRVDVVADPPSPRQRKARQRRGSHNDVVVETWCGPQPPQQQLAWAAAAAGWADAKLPWLEAAPAPLLEAALEAALAHELAAAEGYARLLQGRGGGASARKLRPKKYRCPYCQVGFSNNGQLKGHIRIHTGERPFKCDAAQCGKTFTRNEELTRHKRIHSGLRPYPCTSCGKRFGRKDHLKKHARTHQPPPPPPLPPLALYHYPYVYGY